MCGRGKMFIRLAGTEDFFDWKIVAENVADIFGNPIMANGPEFIDYAERKIKQGEAIAAVDNETGKCVGFIGFSRHHNRITWFGVIEDCRNKGVGSKLLQAALDELDFSKEITVETYKDDYTLGKPARHVYMKHGFVEVDNTLSDHLGNERSKLAISPTPAL